MRLRLVRYDRQDGAPEGSTPQGGAPARRHRRLRTTLKAVVVLAILVLGDMLLSFAMMPVTEHNIWQRYRAHASDPIDSLVVGSSFSIQSFDCTGLDDVLGSRTFSLSWLGASLRSDRMALETAIRDHGITRAYIGIGPETLTDESTADLVKSNVQYTYWKMDGEGLAEQARDLAYLTTDPTSVGDAKSFAALLPWSIDYVDRTPQAIASNIRKKLGYLTGSVQEEPFDYASSTGIGHLYTTTYDINKMTAPSAPAPSSDTTLEPIQANLDELTRICQLCASNGVELYVVVTPRPAYEIYHLGEGYAQLMGQCKQLVEAEGATYLDANAFDPSVYRASETDFADAQHLNEVGSARFTRFVADAVASLEAGGSLPAGSFSYDDWATYLATVKGLLLTGFDGTVEGDGISLDAFSYAGADTQVEYRFSVAYGYADTDAQAQYAQPTQVVRDYGTDAHYTLPTEGHGYVTVRVDARAVGSTSDSERYCVKTFQY